MPATTAMPAAPAVPAATTVKTAAPTTAVETAATAAVASASKGESLRRADQAQREAYGDQSLHDTMHRTLLTIPGASPTRDRKIVHG